MMMIVYILAGIADAAGFFLCMCGLTRAVTMAREEKPLFLAVLLAVAAGMSAGAALAGLPTAVLLLLFFAGASALLNKMGEMDRIAALKGVICLAVTVVADLIVAAVCYEYPEQILEMNGDSQLIGAALCLTATVMAQFITLSAIVLIENRKDSKSIITIILQLKTVEDYFWLNLNPQMALLILAGTAVSYGALLVLVMRTEDRKEQKKREAPAVNMYEYYMSMEEEHRNIRRLYHDMKNKLMILEAGEGENREDIESYVRSTEEKLESMRKFYHTGNPVLDSILFDSRRICENRGITLDVEIEEDSLNFLAEDDMNAIFVNAIMNSIEACEKIEGGDREIRIRAGRNKEDVMLYFRNTAPEDEGGGLKTGKKDKKLHGIGLSSIREAAEKYRGYVSVTREKGTFQLAMLFPGGEK